jgi:hypothetical protein
VHSRFFFLASFSFAAALVVACSSSSSSSSGTGATDSGSSTDSGSGDDGSSTSEASTAPKGDGGDQQLPGSVTAPTTCNAVCAAAGLTCDPNYDWGTDLNDETGSVAAGELEYHDSTDGYAFYGVDCTTVPAKTKDLSGSGNPDELGTLTEFDCACK